MRGGDGMSDFQCDYCEEYFRDSSKLKDHPKCEHGWHIYCKDCIDDNSPTCKLCVEVTA